MLQATLEHFALGFAWFRVMVNDYEALRNDPCIQRVNVTNSARQTLNRDLQRRLGAESTASATEDDGHDDEEHKYGADFVAMAKTIGAQIRLRHSMYYESDEITGLVADANTGISLVIDLREEATSIEQVESATTS